jgi:hypothetical protein
MGWVEIKTNKQGMPKKACPVYFIAENLFKNNMLLKPAKRLCGSS